MNPTHIASLLVLLGPVAPALLSGPAAPAPPPDDWPRWLGPARDGVSRETGWEPKGGRVLWRAAVGLGYSSVAVADGRLFTLGYDGDAGEDVLWCLDALTGEERWTLRWPAELWDRAHDGGTLTTPSVDGDLVYVSNREGRLYCLDAATGDQRWFVHQADEVDDLDPNRWGLAASPLVLDELVVMNAGFVVAYEKATGKRRWISEKSYGSAYSTPALLELDGAPALAIVGGDGLAILSLSKGEELRFQEWTNRVEVNAATPVVTEAGVFISSGYDKGCAMVDVSGNAARVVWDAKVMRNKMAGSLLFDGNLYGFDEAVLKCIDLEGNELWRERGLGQGAHVIADGKIVLLTSRGELVIAEASPGGFRELERAKVLSGGRCWTTPVVANGLLYLRSSRGELVCRDHRPLPDTEDQSGDQSGDQPSGELDG